MTTVNYPNPGTDPTVRVFDDFYQRELVIDQNAYDSVYSFFASIFASKEQAGNFTLAVFQIQEDSGTPVEDLLNELANQSTIQITATLAYYLNNQRSNTTLLGITTVPTPNQYTARNILI
jgi:hypothetical protein|tara:strand:- start:226 stop:585 length:360 start_codon:yes stop_codon:yes gene_type:complete